MSKIKVMIGLDLACNCSGYSILDLSGKVLEAGAFQPIKYPLYTKDKYPVSTLKKARSMADQLGEMIRDTMEKHDVQKIVVEEINPRGSIAAVKALSFVHGMLFWDFMAETKLFTMINCGQWRSKAGVGVVIRRKKGKNDKTNEYKRPIVDYINNRYGSDFALDDHDIVEAIAIVLGYMFINKLLDK